jgi:fido (protein-threonine AMPylation protein)
VRTQEELFELEALNQATAISWLRSQALTRDELLTQAFQHDLHRRMYDQVWTWAGQRRIRENNIGVAPERIVDRWEQLLGNVAYWLDHDTYGPDEACIRYLFEQREIQPFHDGNSRLLRLVVNVLADVSGVSSTGASRYAFGRGSDPTAMRSAYLSAIVDARAGNFQSLVMFSRLGSKDP